MRDGVKRYSDFRELIRCVRMGDQRAAAELVRRFEPQIHNSIRILWANFRLHRVMDMTDISQSVLATFFKRVSAGDFQIDDADQLLKLLSTMARNEVRDEGRKHKAQRRDARRIEGRGSDKRLEVLESGEPAPSKIVAGHELLQAFYSRLTVEERRLAEDRTQGKSWATIALEQGLSPDAVRKKLARGSSRVARELGLADLLLC